MDILIAIFVTFIITAAWQLQATRKIRSNQRLMVTGLVNELNDMAIKLGYRDFISYLEATKGQQYAHNAAQNLKSFYESFTARGPD